MKRIITILLLFLSLNVFAQLPNTIKCVEIASEVADTMILINKPDLDKINTTFYLLDVADSLNSVNEEIISNLTLQTNTLKDLANSQIAIIENQNIQIEHIKSVNQDVISDLEKQVKRANNQKSF